MSTEPPILDVFWQHRTIRFFLRQPIPPEHLDLIIQAGRRAPTDAQGQMFAFIRVTDPVLRDRLATLCNDQQHIRDAAEFFVVCLDVHRLRLLVERCGRAFGMGPRISLIYGATDATMVAQNMVVAAEALGYGTCYIGAVQNNTDVIARALALPKGVLPLYGLCIGVPDPERIPPYTRPRIPQALTFMENCYREPSPEALDEAIAVMSARGDWRDNLVRYFAAGGTMAQREPVMARAWRQQGLEVDGSPVNSER
ncbi:MAG: nitroreductase family protein [Caldilineales bacterium]|nr:nitroreductase family protein [Caldilineales bacterium]MDW8316739.1 nitroreductase family protein [Anaerolineae bacterium]